MKAPWVGLVLAVAGLAPRVAHADMTGAQGIRDHVAGMDVAALSTQQKQALFAERLPISLGLLVPFYGSYALETKVYGELRPSAVVFDWVLGGLVPATLATVALADDHLPSGTRAGLAWTAGGLYAATRVGIVIVGNIHVTDYNDALRVRLGVTPAVTARGPWTLAASADW